MPKDTTVNEIEDMTINLDMDTIAKAFKDTKWEDLKKMLDDSPLMTNITHIDMNDLDLAWHPDKIIVILSPAIHQSPMMFSPFRHELKEKFGKDSVRFNRQNILLKNRSIIYFYSYLSSAGLRGLHPDRIILVNKNRMKSTKLIDLIVHTIRGDKKVDIKNWKW